MQDVLSAGGLLFPHMGRPTNRPRGAFGQRIVSLREAAGFTQQQLAAKLGVQQSNIAFWERWDKPPRGEVLPDLARILGVTADELLGSSKPKRKPSVAKGRLQKVFEQAARLPRRQQQKIVDVVDALVSKHTNDNEDYSESP